MYYVVADVSSAAFIRRIRKTAARSIRLYCVTVCRRVAAPTTPLIDL